MLFVHPLSLSVPNVWFVTMVLNVFYDYLYIISVVNRALRSPGNSLGDAIVE